jgi:hypothetical protein
MAAHFPTPSKASGREVKDSGKPAEGVPLGGLGVGVKGEQVEFHAVKLTRIRALRN